MAYRRIPQDPETIQQTLREHMGKGMDPKQSAAALGISLMSWYRYAKANGLTTAIRIVEAITEGNRNEEPTTIRAAASRRAGRAGAPDREAHGPLPGEAGGRDRSAAAEPAL